MQSYRVRAVEEPLQTLILKPTVMIYPSKGRVEEAMKDARPAGANPMNEAVAWKSVLNRDTSADDRILYGVTTTGIYCRPSCPSRRPKRDNVAFFSSAEAAERAGFRACRRCHPNRVKSTTTAVQRARSYIDAHITELGEERITLEVLGDVSGVSPSHLQRKFKESFGLSPAQYVRARKSERLKDELKRGETVSRATFGAGYGSSSRVYEAADASLGMTPATYRRGGLGMHIDYVITPTSLGALMVAATQRGVCAVMLGDDASFLESALTKEYPAAIRARVSASSARLGGWVAAIVEGLQGEKARTDIPIDVQASAFRWRVWHALQKIPFGETRTYTEVAEAIGAPGAARAVASACATNPVSLVVPCHRVVRRGGDLGGYRWGIERKRTLLDNERNARESGK